MQVEDIQGDNVVCTAANHATLDGLVTIFHTERSPDVLNNIQNDLPIMTDDDKSAIQELAAEFEIDFISLSFTRAGEDVQAAREFLDSINMQTTKVLHKTGSVLPLCRLCRSLAHAAQATEHLLLCMSSRCSCRQKLVTVPLCTVVAIKL